MKTLFQCQECQRYTLHDEQCPQCGGKVKNPYPAKFSLVKEQRYRSLIRENSEKQTS